MKPITFNVLADAVNKAWQRMLGHPLYFLNCGGQEVWHTYYDNLIDENDTPIRAVHPDHLNKDLLPHRQVLDYLADTQKVVPSNDALAGIGFNTDSTKEQYAIVKVIGTHTRVLKVKF